MPRWNTGFLRLFLFALICIVVFNTATEDPECVPRVAVHQQALQANSGAAGIPCDPESCDCLCCHFTALLGVVHFELGLEATEAVYQKLPLSFLAVERPAPEQPPRA